MPTSLRLCAAVSALVLTAPVALAQTVAASSAPPLSCNIPAATVQRIQAQLAPVVVGGNGGLFNPNRMWSAVVDRAGRVCSVVSIGDAWPGSRAIAMAKAYTANAFSNSALALSTANLYSAIQPGGSLYGLNHSNPFDPERLDPGERAIGKVAGGIITFGGGVALYQNGQVIGGLGLSGDTACADHVIAYRMRALAALAPVAPVGGVGPGGTDDIVFFESGDAPSGFKHPRC